jgi:succinoglycan biosynthesis protein ExoM
MNSVLIGVCTYKRPLMLAKCLESLAGQIGTEHLQLHIVVVDNEPDAPQQSFVQDFAEGCPFPVHYRHEPKLGIAAARNAIIDTAGVLESDWIAFIDDNETAAPNWVEQLTAAEYASIPVLMGRKIFTGPESAHFSYINQDDAAQLLACTNVRLSSGIFRDGFRFEDDKPFLATIINAGYEMRKTGRALMIGRVDGAVQIEKSPFWERLRRKAMKTFAGCPLSSGTCRSRIG